MSEQSKKSGENVSVSKKKEKESGESSPTLDIGIVLGGAVSAGAYTAGVLDFLFEALETWEKAKEEDKGKGKTPGHNIKINVVSGGSAGGMIAAISALELRGSPHKPPVKKNGKNGKKEWTESTSRFYQAWVNKVTLNALLDNLDLQDGQPAKSILNTNVILDTAKDILTVKDDVERHPRPYISDDLAIILTLTNLRGVPYDIKFEGNKVLKYGMRMHKDYIIFHLDSEGNLHYNNHNLSSEEAWKKLSGCGVAAGIFPIGLAPQMISHKIRDYDGRKWLIPKKEKFKNNELFYVFKEESIKPDWPSCIGDERDAEFRFLAVDGGVFNNEPFDLTRRWLVEKNMRGKTGDKNGGGAILLIDPFPETVTCDPDYDVQGNIIETIPQLLRALLNQGRFKVDEVFLAGEHDTCRRYMIVPKRNGEFSKRPLACGYLGGFSGFFDIEFRRHDYFLGRRNCQQFLRKHFARTFENEDDRKADPFFGKWNDDMIKKYAYMDPHDKTNQIYFPFIPLMEEKKEKIEKYPYPEYSEKSLDEYRIPLKKRAKMVLKSILRNDLKLSKALSGPIAWYIARCVAPKILKAVKNSFKKKDGLIRETKAA